MKKNYEMPPVSLLDQPKETLSEDVNYLDQAKATLQAILDSHGINGMVCNTVVGPRVTRFEIDLQPGVRLEKVTPSLNHIAENMRVKRIRVLAPVPGSDKVGIELPNQVSNQVCLRELMESDAWRETKAEIPFFLGKDTDGNVKIADLSKAPHMLVAGATGSGKSVFINTLIISLLYRFAPDELKLILIDPKFMEFEHLRSLPHLITPVVNDPIQVSGILRWGVRELEHRYQIMARVKAKNLQAFNSRPLDPEPVMDENGDPIPQKLPRLIIIVDELAEVMMSKAWKNVETSISRLAQRGRAAGIHLVIATQTPRKDIITGVIKANLPTKIAFKVSSGMDSRVILDSPGAEKLLGRGDMLFKGPGGDMGERIQCAMVSDSEIRKIVNFVSSQAEQQFDPAVFAADQGKDDGENDGQDDFLDEVTDQYLQPVMALIEEIRDNMGDEDDGQRELLDEMVYEYLEPLMTLIEEKKDEAAIVPQNASASKGRRSRE
ncbi:MAG: hypothetical protein J5858_07170 [Lentisphaeria bacterium]|nr:hypothetical protein [Lentisphaeria bacterium]